VAGGSGRIAGCLGQKTSPQAPGCGTCQASEVAPSPRIHRSRGRERELPAFGNVGAYAGVSADPSQSGDGCPTSCSAASDLLECHRTYGVEPIWAFHRWAAPTVHGRPGPRNLPIKPTEGDHPHEAHAFA